MAVTGVSIGLLGLIFAQMNLLGVFIGVLLGFLGVAVSFAGVVDEHETARQGRPPASGRP